ncbi:hypothetical protein HC248_01830 [Polaromonas vacuolata]|uniref:GST N-terminal domain-containing protein n=1 Tax=Polaromonas vacuolata TaxID=37448 RepID=A0A6H2HAA1_9BURK|nr:glutathione S-transferase N-terminal domain-containing protein [Polaromonas vacuolata]QJC56524.1 hypothetical protein HC248_01830 [Polaromonas vacuolata]
MKFLIRLFFKTVRTVMGPLLLIWEIIKRPKPMHRQAALQAKVDNECRDLALFQFKTCPFCMKIRQEMHRLSLPIERRDAQHDAANRTALIAGAGSAKVPCLKITNAKGKVEWLTDSKAIISYLRGRFENAGI